MLKAKRAQRETLPLNYKSTAHPRLSSLSKCFTESYSHLLCWADLLYLFKNSYLVAFAVTVLSTCREGVTGTCLCHVVCFSSSIFECI